MKIELHTIKVRDVYAGYADNDEEGVFGYGGKLNIRPPFQREFVYGEKQRNAVIDTVMRGFPLNTLYWSRNPENDSFELLDGQQRTVSICQYVDGVFNVGGRYFHNLPRDEQEKILDYELMVYWCEGTDSEKLNWFEIINLAGKPLTAQELRNAVYTGPWLSDAKRYFSKTNCAAYKLGSDYVEGAPINQVYLEKVLRWITPTTIEDYMATHQHESNASEIWLYFQAIINWVRTIFPKYRKEMKLVDWGTLYNQFKNAHLDTVALNQQVDSLMDDSDVTNKKGIYTYVLTGDERHLSIRQFPKNDRRTAYERQRGKCAKCGKVCDFDDMEADHIDPWSRGGKTVAENCQMLCKPCNRRKSDV